MSDESQRAILRSEKWRLFLVALACVALSALLRLASFGEPPERDIEIYSTIASGLLAGEPLYSELLDIKPPGIFLIYALFQLFVGDGALQYFVIGTAFAALTGFSLYCLLLARTNSVAAAGAGCGLWLLASIDLQLQANQPNAEVAMNGLLAAGLAVAYCGRGTVLRAIGAGLLLALSTFVKQALGPAVVLLAAAISLRGTGARERLLRFVSVLAPSALLWLGAWAWFASDGRGQLFGHLVLDYPREYATIFGTTMAQSLAKGLGAAALGPIGAKAVVALAIALSLLAIALTAWARRWLDSALVGAWAVGAWFTVSAPGHFYAHYFQLWLPLLAFASGLSLALFLRAGRSRWLAIGAFAAVTLAVTHPIPRNLTKSPEQWSLAKYGPDFIEYESFASNLKQMLEPDDTVFVWGVYPSVYRITQKRAPTGIANVWLTIPAYGGSYAQRWSNELMQDLARTPPDAIVVDRFTLDFAQRDHAIRPLLASGYRPVARSGDRISLLVRRDSDLMRRLQSSRPR